MDKDKDKAGRSPHGERGLKSGPGMMNIRILYRRSPHGERGLKSGGAGSQAQCRPVAPLTGSVD